MTKNPGLQWWQLPMQVEEVLGTSGPGVFSRARTLPAVNIAENDMEYLLEIAAPGLMKEDFVIRIDGSMLIVEGESKTSQEMQLCTYHRQEFCSHAFTRVFHLPEDMDTQHITARYAHGMLRVILPKKGGGQWPATARIEVG